MPVHLVGRQAYVEDDDEVECLEEMRGHSMENFTRGRSNTMKKTMRAYVFSGVHS